MSNPGSPNPNAAPDLDSLLFGNLNNPDLRALLNSGSNTGGGGGGFFGNNFGTGLESPSSMPLLGLLQGLGAAAGPSRMPVSMGQVFGSAAQGYQQGLMGKQQYEQSQIDTQSKLMSLRNQMIWQAAIKQALDAQTKKGGAAGAPDAAATPDATGAAAPGTVTPSTTSQLAAAANAATQPPVATTGTTAPTTPTAAATPTQPGVATGPPRALPTTKALDTAIAGVDWNAYANNANFSESSGDPNAVPTLPGTNIPASSARGTGGFLKGTWLEEVRKAHPELANMPDAQVLALRAQPPVPGGPDYNKDATIQYGKDNAAILQENGLPINQTTLYTMHVLGPGDGVKALKAPDNTALRSIVSPKALAANPWMGDLTNTGFVNRNAKKMNEPPTPGGMLNVAGAQGAQSASAGSATPQGTKAATAAANVTADGTAPTAESGDLLTSMFSNMTPQKAMFLTMLGPEGYAKLAMSQKRELTPDEVAAKGWPKGTTALTDMLGNLEIVRQPPAQWRIVPQEEWGEYNVDPKNYPPGTLLKVNELSEQPYLIFPQRGWTDKLTPEGLAGATYTYLTTNKVPSGLGPAASADIISNAEKLKPPGMSEQDWTNFRINGGLALEIRKKAGEKVGQMSAVSAVNEDSVKAQMAYLKAHLKDYASAGQFTDINSFYQMLGRRTNDHNAVLLQNAIDTIANEYAKVTTGNISGSGATDASREQTSGLLLKGYNAGTLDAAMKQMDDFMTKRSDSFNGVLQKLITDSKGLTTLGNEMPSYDASGQPTSFGPTPVPIVGGQAPPSPVEVGGASAATPTATAAPAPAAAPATAAPAAAAPPHAKMGPPTPGRTQPAQAAPPPPPNAAGVTWLPASPKTRVFTKDKTGKMVWLFMGRDKNGNIGWYNNMGAPYKQ